MWVLADAPVWMRDDGPRSLQHHHRPPLLGRFARGARPIRGNRLDGLAGEASHLARMWGQDAVLTQLRLGTRSIRQGVEGVRVNDEWTGDMLQEVEHEAPRGTVASQPWPDHTCLSSRELAQHDVICGVADRSRSDFLDGCRHHLSALRR